MRGEKSFGDPEHAALDVGFEDGRSAPFWFHRLEKAEGAQRGGAGTGTRRGGRLTGSYKKIRVVVADDHGLFRQGVVEMLSFADDAEGVEVVGEASDHDGAVELVLREGPDVVLLDLEMPGMGADESMRRMLSLSPPPRVVILTMHDEPGMVGRFLRQGAAGYFPKSAEMDELVEAVREAAGADPDPAADGKAQAPPHALRQTGDGRGSR